MRNTFLEFVTFMMLAFAAFWAGSEVLQSIYYLIFK